MAFSGLKCGVQSYAQLSSRLLAGFAAGGR